MNEERKTYLTAPDTKREEIRECLESAEQMYNVLRLMPCICIRKFPYNGPIVQPCGMHLALKRWEDLMRLSDAPGSAKRHLESVIV